MNLDKNIICNSKDIASEYLELGLDNIITKDIHGNNRL